MLMLQTHTWFTLNKYRVIVVEKQGKQGREFVDFPVRAENNRRKGKREVILFVVVCEWF